MSHTETPIPHETADHLQYTSPDAVLREAGLRVTALRVQAIALLDAMPHSSADELFEALREHVPGTSIQATYNVLTDLTTAGLLRRIEPGNSPARYERRVGDNHHHLVCRGCGQIIDIDCVTGQAPCLHFPDDHGFTIDEAEVVFWGLCPGCTSNTTTTPEGVLA